MIFACAEYGYKFRQEARLRLRESPVTDAFRIERSPQGLTWRRERTGIFGVVDSRLDAFGGAGSMAVLVQLTAMG
jgi:hypothetical protein